MPLKQRALTLAAVVAIPLGIAATSYALTDAPPTEKAPAEVRMESGTPTAEPTSTPKPKDEAVPPRPQDDADDAADDDTAADDGADDAEGRDGGTTASPGADDGDDGADDDEDDGPGDD